MANQFALQELPRSGIELLVVSTAEDLFLLEVINLMLVDALMPLSKPALIPFVFAMMVKNPFETLSTIAALLANVLNVDACLMQLSNASAMHLHALQELVLPMLLEIAVLLAFLLLLNATLDVAEASSVFVVKVVPSVNLFNNSDSSLLLVSVQCSLVSMTKMSVALFVRL
jgi:hypothetical protein